MDMALSIPANVTGKIGMDIDNEEIVESLNNGQVVKKVELITDETPTQTELEEIQKVVVSTTTTSTTTTGKPKIRSVRQIRVNPLFKSSNDNVDDLEVAETHIFRPLFRYREETELKRKIP